MTPPVEWYREQSDYNRRFYEWLHAARPDDANDWKVAALFYSGLHRANCRFARREGKAPENHFERNRPVKRELPQVFEVCKPLYLMRIGARYTNGFRTNDDRRSSAGALLRRIENAIPF